MKVIKKYWYIMVIAVLLLLQITVFSIFGEDSYIQVHDNLDLFIPHFNIMRLKKLFFSNGDVPVLHGISRDLLGSEFLITNILYYFLPPFVAYILGYFLKICVGTAGLFLLFLDCLKQDDICIPLDKLYPVIAIVSFAFGLIPVFPVYGTAFTSIPFLVLLVRKITRIRDNNGKVSEYILPWTMVFFYPLLSYFSYHGFFLLAYLFLYFIVRSISKKSFEISLLFTVVILALGYVVWEYRLFRAMLLGNTVTIRDSMNRGSSTLLQALVNGCRELVFTSFHSQDSHTYVILPVVIFSLIFFVIKGKRYSKRIKSILVCIGCITFNSLIFGLYEIEAFRNFFIKLIPQLSGFDFSRMSFLSPFLWYFLFGLCLVEICGRGYAKAAYGLSLLALLLVMFFPQTYNDFYYTVYNQSYKILLNKETNGLSFGEFYSQDLFDNIKSDIGYNNEWSAAYGFHPGILTYNGISTLDGYLGMYSQEYKDEWYSVIEPALAGSPSLNQYFTDWGARVCLYSGSDENTYRPDRKLILQDNRLMVDIGKLRELDCKYIFSRIEIINARELDIKLLSQYTEKSSPYAIYVYILD